MIMNRFARCIEDPVCTQMHLSQVEEECEYTERKTTALGVKVLLWSGKGGRERVRLPIWRGEV